MRKWQDDLRLMHLCMGVFWWETHWLVNSSKWEELCQEVMWHNDDVMEKPKDFPKGYKKVKWVAQSTRTTYIMASEVFLAVFLCTIWCTLWCIEWIFLRWWINESIRDFIAPTFMCRNTLQACTVWRKGHRPKVLLWIMEEFFYISHDLTEQDCDGRIVLSYKLMIEAEHWYRVKRGGGIGCHRPSPSSGNAPPCSGDTLEHIAWSEPDSKTLERLVWSVYDGVLSPGPTPKLTGPKTYNQVTRWLAAKVFWGLQVHCPARTSAQFDEPSPVRKVWSVGLHATPKWKCKKGWCYGHGHPKKGGHGRGSSGRRCGSWRGPRHAPYGMDAQLSTLLRWWND